MIEKLRRSINRLTGYDVIRWAGMHTDSSALYHALRNFNIDCVLDVGANEGQFAKKIRSLGFAGDIISYEPVSTAYKKLQMNSKDDDKWLINNFALGAVPGYADINVSQSTVFSSLLNTTNFAKENWKSCQVESTENVEIKTLDSLMLENKFNGYENILLKIDAQGFDLQVISGAESLIQLTPLIYTEVSLRKVYEQSPSFDETLTYLSNIGYYQSAIYPVTRAKDFTLNEVDVLFAKRA